MKIYLILLLFIFLSPFIFSQSEDVWFPSELNIQPFRANFLEPKAGFEQFLGEKQLRLDIGTSHDILHFINQNKVLSFGFDFFTYTRLREEKQFLFPVDAVTYFFGINTGYKISEGNSSYGFRFRLSHISAHFADGHFDNGSNEWRNDQAPRVYSREFLELFPFYEINNFRTYIGLTYLFHVDPEYVGRGIFQTGFDYGLTCLGSKLFTPYVAYDFKLMDIRKYSGSNIISAGIKFGNYDSNGVRLVLSYFSGKSVQGEYFDQNEHYATLGINLDL
jgi:Protein of unknown function (DUF1207)